MDSETSLSLEVGLKKTMEHIDIYLRCWLATDLDMTSSGTSISGFRLLKCTLS